MYKAFRFYRLMSYVTGTTLLILFALLLLHTVDLSAWERIHWFVVTIGVGHGVVLYPIYFVACVTLAVRARLPLPLVVVMLLAGFVPGLAFYMEHLVEKKYSYLKGAPS